MCTHIYMCTCMSITPTWAHAYIDTCVYTYMHVYTHRCMCRYLHQMHIANISQIGSLLPELMAMRVRGNIRVCGIQVAEVSLLRVSRGLWFTFKVSCSYSLSSASAWSVCWALHLHAHAGSWAPISWWVHTCSWALAAECWRGEGLVLGVGLGLSRSHCPERREVWGCVVRVCTLCFDLFRLECFGVELLGFPLITKRHGLGCRMRM